MAVSKRLRYEVFRRDNHACRYCGESAPDVKVTVDHVVPKALGGTDDPSNLVTACKDCNGGKTSTNPDAPLVADVAQDALRWSRAIAQAAQEMLTSGGTVSEAHKQFASVWDGWTYGDDEEPKQLPKDPGWKQTVDALLAAGLPMVLLEECIQIAMARRNVAPENTFRYMCGVAWRKVGQLQQRARELTQNPAEVSEGSTEETTEDDGDVAIQNWCRLSLRQRDPREVEVATRKCLGYVCDDDPSGVLWFVIEGLECDRSALRDGLLELMRALPGDVGTELIKEHEAFYQERFGPDYSPITALFTASQHAADRVALDRARQEMAFMPRDEYKALIQRARDENAEIAEHLTESYYVSEGARMAREAAA